MCQGHAGGRMVGHQLLRAQAGICGWASRALCNLHGAQNREEGPSVWSVGLGCPHTPVSLPLWRKGVGLESRIMTARRTSVTWEGHSVSRPHLHVGLHWQGPHGLGNLRHGGMADRVPSWWAADRRPLSWRAADGRALSWRAADGRPLCWRAADHRPLLAVGRSAAGPEL